MTDETTLLRCAFFTRDYEKSYKECNGWFSRCCECKTKGYKSSDGLIKRSIVEQWNRRHTEDDLR